MIFMKPVCPNRVFKVSLTLSSEQDLGSWNLPTETWIEKQLAQPMASIFQAKDIVVKEINPTWRVKLGTWLFGSSWHLDHCSSCIKIENGHRPCFWFVSRVMRVI